MDNYPGFGYGNYIVPLALNEVFFDNADALNYFSELDEMSRDEIVNSSHDFQSREEMERYLYHLHQKSEEHGGA